MINILHSLSFCMHATQPTKRWIGLNHVILSKEEFKHLQEISGKGLIEFSLIAGLARLHHHFNLHKITCAKHLYCQK